jgi:hypothetical protein
VFTNLDAHSFSFERDGRVHRQKMSGASVAAMVEGLIDATSAPP